MIDLLFVADGTRDHVTIPPLVGRLLGVNVRAMTTPWARLRQQSGVSGYRRQLRFAIRQARDANAVAILATVDRDKDPRRRKLKELLVARDEDRISSPAFPTALGEADPHGEAWLLDDPVAVRRALRLAGDATIPTVRHTNRPKDALEDLRRQSGRAEDSILEVLADIAELVDPARCVHAKETGFHALAEEVRREFGPVASQCDEQCRCGDVCGRAHGHGT
jgi:hypothetical protein